MANTTVPGQPAVDSELAGLFEALQEQRSTLADAVREAQLHARLLVLEEVRRLKAERGPADPRVKRYEDGSSVSLRRIAALEVEAQIARIRVPPVASTGALLQGRVTDEASHAVAHVTVTLIDENGKPVAGVPPAETDDAGYYAFVLEPAQVGAIGPDARFTLQVGSRSGKLLVPAAVVPLSLTPGKAIAAEMRLQESELDALQLRPAFRSAEAPAQPPAKGAKAAAKPGKHP